MKERTRVGTSQEIINPQNNVMSETSDIQAKFGSRGYGQNEERC